MYFGLFAARNKLGQLHTSASVSSHHSNNHQQISQSKGENARNGSNMHINVQRVNKEDKRVGENYEESELLAEYNRLRKYMEELEEEN
jgi:hypothetical protein